MTSHNHSMKHFNPRMPFGGCRACEEGGEMTTEIERLRDLMLDWTEGLRSNWNEFAGHADESLSAARAACAVADAQEVVKLSAAIQALCAIEGLSA